MQQETQSKQKERKTEINKKSRRRERAERESVSAGERETAEGYV